MNIFKVLFTFFEQQHAVLISYSKEEYFSYYFYIYKSQLGRIAYKL